MNQLNDTLFPTCTPHVLNSAYTLFYAVVYFTLYYTILYTTLYYTSLLYCSFVCRSRSCVTIITYTAPMTVD